MSYQNQQGNTYMVSENPSEVFKASVNSRRFFVVKLLATISASASLLALIFLNVLQSLGIVVNLLYLLVGLAPLVLECIGYWLLQKEGAESDGRMENPVGLTLVKVVAIYEMVLTVVFSVLMIVLFFVAMFATEQIANALGSLGGMLSGLGGGYAQEFDSFSLSAHTGSVAFVLLVLLFFIVIFGICFLCLWYSIKKIKMLSALKSMMIGERLRENESYELSEYVAYFNIYQAVQSLSGAAVYIVLLPVVGMASAIAFFYLLMLAAQVGCDGVADILISTGMITYNKRLAEMNANNRAQVDSLQRQLSQSQQEISDLQRQVEDLMRSSSGPSVPPGPKPGTITCIGGSMRGATIDISDGSEYLIGRDPQMCGIVIDSSYTKVSKKHVGIIFDAGRRVYKIVDYSTNGTFRTDGKRLVAGKYNLLTSGNTITLASTDNRFILN